MSVQTEYIERIAKIIKKEASKRGYKYPSAIIAQACLESGYGRSTLAKKYHNHFGMKCGSAWKGASVNMNTKEEYKAGVISNISANFRAYASDEEGIAGYFDFISAKRYENLKSATSAQDYLQKIKNDGYATSFSYVKNTMAIVTTYKLTKYDGTETTPATVELLSFDEIVKEVLAGKWGNGNTRKSKLTKAGYDYKAIQAEVNKRLKGK